MEATSKLAWTWKPTPGGGYEGLFGRAVLHKRDKTWFLTLDGKEHEIKSRKPSFDHAEGIIQQELGDTMNSNRLLHTASTTKVVERYKLGAAKPPKRLLALLHRTLGPAKPDYGYREGLHEFAYSSHAARFAVDDGGLKVLLRNGLAMIQSIPGGSVLWSFKPTQAEESTTSQAVSTSEARQMGKDAFKVGKPRVPSQDRDLMSAMRLVQQGGNGITGHLDAWLHGWDAANLAEPLRA